MRIVDRIDGIMRSSLLRPFVQRFSEHYFPSYIKNINNDLTRNDQKRALLVYTSLIVVDINIIPHANLHHLNQMIYCLVQKDYCIDLCKYSDVEFYESNKDVHYDVIIGLGIVYKLFIKKQIQAKKVLFLTENNPIVVREKYSERLDYFNKRHPNLDYSKASIRQNCFDIEMIEMSDFVVSMNSDYNTESLKTICNKIYTIHSNAVLNPNYVFQKPIVYDQTAKHKYSFVMFGVNGLIHKGLDILVDVFDKLPECTLNVYGISPKEKHLFRKISKKNTIDCGTVNVLSQDFIDKVVNKNSFVILDSCSEGMSTGVATCMAHGLIPIVTKETGFPSVSCIYELPNYRVESVYSFIVDKIMPLSIDEIVNHREKVYEYARKEFSLIHFTDSFNTILDNIIG
jgi:hypothetical protein